MKNTKPKVRLWSVLTGLTAILTVAAIVGNIIANQYATTLNVALNASTYKIIHGENTGDTEYFKKGFASDEEREAYEAELCATVEAEGAALLKNENNALPLASGAKVSLFGHGSVDLMYGGTGSGSVDTSKAPNLKQALEAQGITINQTLWDLYSSDSMMSKYSRMTPASISDTLEANTQYAVNEAPWSALSSAESSFAEYGDAAIVVLSRSGGEGADLPSGENGTSDSWISGQEGDGNYLALSAEEIELLQNLKALKDNGTFKKIVVLINSSNAIELDFLNPEICGEDYGIDAAMWIGDVGQTGINGVGQLLSGAVTPSGSLVDTYLYDNMANPAMYNFYTQAYPNAAEYNLLTEGADVQGMYSVYQEGIYLGYRYFETRYEDVVMGTAKAGDYNWATTVAYPFGYGDSYTTFAYSNFNVTESDDAFTVTLKVTNTGKTFSGKETVQIYFQSPYTAYDKANGIEKAAAELCGFAKTDVLAPGASEDVTITVPKSELRTYDANNAKTYIVDAGDYYFTAATDSHNAVNNILAAKGYTVENTNGRMTEDGSTDLVWKWTNDTLDTTTFSTGANGTAITNLFDESDPNKSSNAPGSVTWMSRSDWTGTIPTAPAQLTANETLAASLAFTQYDGSEANSIEMPTLGAKNGLTLASMIGKDFDDPEWDTLLDQLTYSEMVQTMKWLQKCGVKGLKVDFFGSDKQQMMGLYEDILTDANEYGLMIIFHGCTIPRGWERMYPNYVGSEAVLASENLIFNQHFDDMEAYNACLHPFIRNTIGCMEFGGTLLNKRHNRTNDGGTIRKTTDVFQLATAVLYQNPIQNFALAPNNLTDAPALAIDFMKQVPTTWDETVFLDGYPGKYCVLARRHGDRWYVVGVNAQKEPLKLSLNLPMWEKGETVSYYLDDKKRQPQLEELKIKNPVEVKVVLQPDGGIILVK